MAPTLLKWRRWMVLRTTGKGNGKLERHDTLLFGFDRCMHEIVEEQKTIRWVKQHPVNLPLYYCYTYSLSEVARLVPLDKILPYLK